MTTPSEKLWGRDAHPLISLENAWTIIAQQVTPLGTQRIPITSAHRRVLRQPVTLKEDYPAFDRAAMDGYALRSADCAQPGTSLRITGLAAAGTTISAPLEPGCAARINTGAAVPPGADTVIRVEDTAEAQGRVTIRAPVKPEMNIRRQGADRKKGDAVLSPPCRLGPAQIAAAIGAGVCELDVTRTPTVAILPTGNELAPAGAPLVPGQIHESNGPMLAALVNQLGAAAANLGTVKDDPTSLRDKLTVALSSDLVLTIGGMSMGTLDLVPQACADLGVRWLFHGIDMRPGKPTAYGAGPRGQHVLGLPGNPVSAFVCAALFAAPIIRGLNGFPPCAPALARATLAHDLRPAKDSRPAFIPAKVTPHPDGHSLLETVTWGGSGDPFGLSDANALLFRPRPGEMLHAGNSVEALLLD